jgi:hypothetical protein
VGEDANELGLGAVLENVNMLIGCGAVPTCHLQHIRLRRILRRCRSSKR